MRIIKSTEGNAISMIQTEKNKMVKQSLYRLGQTHRVPGG
jgi:hypothetical protein